jgi:hypothetical protein
VWVALAAFVTVAWAVSIPSHWTMLKTICHTTSACDSSQLDASAARTLSQHGISIEAFAVYAIAVSVVFLSIWIGLGALIIWRKPEDRGALLSAFFLILFPSFLDPSIPLSVTFLGLILFGLLFPDGRFAPRWTRWLALAAILASMSTILSDGVAALATLVIVLFTVPLQIYRFRAISSWAQRQQTKWALFGLTAGILGFASLLILPSILLVPSQTQNGSLFSALSSSGDFVVVVSAIPISLAIAVLRSRLWDIDRIVSRALVYTALSVTLVGIYLGSVVGLQALFRTISGQQSELAVAISTLVIASLFNPLRNRIQDVIARTFSRRKYNAQQVLAAFGATCRDETDLEKLKDEMMRVVEETVQPAGVSLWLRDSRREV